MTKHPNSGKCSSSGTYWIYALHRDGVAIARIGCGPCTWSEADVHVQRVIEEFDFGFDPSDRLEIRKCKSEQTFCEHLSKVARG